MLRNLVKQRPCQKAPTARLCTDLRGYPYAADHPDKRLTLQVVGRRTEIYELDEWGERAPRTQIIAIGESGGIDAQELSYKFDACIE